MAAVVEDSAEGTGAGAAPVVAAGGPAAGPAAGGPTAGGADAGASPAGIPGAPGRTARRRRRRRPAGRSGAAGPRTGALVAGGLASAWLTLIVLIPLAAVVARSFDGGAQQFLDAITNRQAIAALRFTLLVSLVVVAIDAVMGVLIAWVLVRDEFRGKSVVNALIDLPFALPTIVAGLTLLALYGNRSPVGINVAYTQAGVALALLFVTLPFVVRAVQPVLMALDREAEEAAASLGAGPVTTFRRIILPALRPAIFAGVALAFGRAVGEFGAIVLISGNLPFKTEVASVFVFSRIESDATTSAAAVSVLLLVISFALLLGISFLARRREDM
ncbi:MAG: sulfate/thiosulfate transport system permease protein [Solirubrobacteraceae bacterium]|nr:sulfate/thiosulfate transport system permease protein [Solirubrobacteraceae bacterium]